MSLRLPTGPQKVGFVHSKSMSTHRPSSLSIFQGLRAKTLHCSESQWGCVLGLPGLAVPCGVRGVTPDLQQHSRQQRLPFSPVSRLGKGSEHLVTFPIPTARLFELCCQTEKSLFLPPPLSFPAQVGDASLLHRLP